MIVYAFRKAVCPGPFCESIIRNRPRTFAEIRRRAVEHIASEGEVCEKRTTVVPSRPRAHTRVQPVRVNETTTERKKPEGRRLYETRKPQPRPRGPAGGDRPVRERARPARYNFAVKLKDLIAVPNIAERLRRPAKTDKVLGPRKDSWCEFHEAFDHHIDNCLSLGYQLDELVRSGPEGLCCRTRRDTHPAGAHRRTGARDARARRGPYHRRRFFWWRTHRLPAEEIREGGQLN